MAKTKQTARKSTAAQPRRSMPLAAQPCWEDWARMLLIAALVAAVQSETACPYGAFWHKSTPFFPAYDFVHDPTRRRYVKSRRIAVWVGDYATDALDLTLELVSLPDSDWELIGSPPNAYLTPRPGVELRRGDTYFTGSDPFSHTISGFPDLRPVDTPADNSSPSDSVLPASDPSFADGVPYAAPGTYTPGPTSPPHIATNSASDGYKPYIPSPTPVYDPVGM